MVVVLRLKGRFMMMMRNIAGIVLLLAFVGFGQNVQGASSCGGSTYDTYVCRSKIYQKADAELNSAYRAALKDVGDNYSKRDIENLQDAERAWIAYRDAQCKAQYELFGGGSGGPNEKLGCMIDMTSKRTAEIKRVYLVH
jgi:uncharacterized protein YecT (DUF1311 family)